MTNYSNEIAAEEKTLKEIKEIKRKYETHSSEVLFIPYEKILKEQKDYESLSVLA